MANQVARKSVHISADGGVEVRTEMRKIAEERDRAFDQVTSTG
jgi:hypothetical protein